MMRHAAVCCATRGAEQRAVGAADVDRAVEARAGSAARPCPTSQTAALPVVTEVKIGLRCSRARAGRPSRRPSRRRRLRPHRLPHRLLVVVREELRRQRARASARYCVLRRGLHQRADVGDDAPGALREQVAHRRRATDGARTSRPLRVRGRDRQHAAELALKFGPFFSALAPTAASAIGSSSGVARGEVVGPRVRVGREHGVVGVVAAVHVEAHERLVAAVGAPAAARAGAAPARFISQGAAAAPAPRAPRRRSIWRRERFEGFICDLHFCTMYSGLARVSITAARRGSSSLFAIASPFVPPLFGAGMSIESTACRSATSGRVDVVADQARGDVVDERRGIVREARWPRSRSGCTSLRAALPSRPLHADAALHDDHHVVGVARDAGLGRDLHLGQRRGRCARPRRRR